MWRVLLGSCLLGLQVSSRTQCGDKLDIVFDTEGPVHSPWRNHTHCSQFVTRFAEADSLPATALVSFPGSGSSWLRPDSVRCRVPGRGQLGLRWPDLAPE